MTKKVYYKDKYVAIYIDTNVLRNYCTGQKAEMECLNFLFSKRKRNKLFTSTLAIGQIISVIQKKKGISGTMQDMHLFNPESVLEKRPVRDKILVEKAFPHSPRPVGTQY